MTGIQSIDFKATSWSTSIFDKCNRTMGVLIPSMAYQGSSRYSRATTDVADATNDILVVAKHDGFCSYMSLAKEPK